MLEENIKGKRTEVNAISVTSNYSIVSRGHVAHFIGPMTNYEVCS